MVGLEVIMRKLVALGLFVAAVSLVACKVCTLELNGNMGGEGCEAPARDAGADGGGNG